MTLSISSEILSALDLNDFVTVDIETTGLDYLKEDIIEFAAVHFRGGKRHKKTNFFVKPPKKIPQHITRITGISNADVEGAKSFAAVVDDIKSFIGDYPVIAHNINFDLPFLEYHTRKAKNDFMMWDYQVKQYNYFSNWKIDTAVLSRMYLHFLPSFNLHSLSEYFGLKKRPRHRALPDAATTGEIFLELLKIILRTKFADTQKINQILEPTDDPIKQFFEKLTLLQASGRFQIPEGIDRESFMITANFYNIIGEGETPDHGRMETDPIDEEVIANFFDDGGELSREFASFEVRKPQVQMAHAVARAFNESRFLVVEAGTGTGKSMAYLVPAIKWAVKNYGPNGRVIISTNTKNLQEQLFFKDIPILHGVLKERFKAVLLKGKGNYLCLDKWVTVLNDMKFRLSEKERTRILPLYFWTQQTKTGDIAGNNAFHAERNMGLWTKLIAENNYCPGRSCKYYDKCFLMKARNNARNAHLVLVNHSLLFSDLAAENAVLSDYVNVIFDEAHNIEKTATEYLGSEISIWQFRDFYNKLYMKDKIETGVLIQLKRRIQLSSVTESHKKGLLSMIEGLIDKVPGCWRLTQEFFKELTRQLRDIQPERDHSYSVKHRYKRENNLFEPLSTYHQELIKELSKIQNELNDLIEYFKELPDNSFEYQKQLYQELNAQFMQVEMLSNNLHFLLEAEWDNFVYWFELPAKSDSDDSRLYAAPLDIAGILNERLYSHLRTTVFTSATLAVNRNFEYFNNRVGVRYIDAERVENLLLESPFNYDEQVLLMVPSFIVDPKHPQYLPQLKSFLEKLIAESPRGTLALFTSYSILNDVYNSLKHTFLAENIPVFGQGIDGSRHSIISQFKNIEKSFLFGTDSFWEGVDVPGKALEVLLLTRLPFDVPSEPIIQAKAELIQKQGGNPFMDFTIPEAVIRFRQGFGRLIRSKSDFGSIIILDSRVINKLYGRVFLNSLPLRAKIITEDQTLWQHLKNWFGGTKIKDSTTYQG